MVVVSIEDQEKAKATQADFPHLAVVSDPEHRLIDAVAILHPGAAPDGSDIATPTTLLVDGTGTVRWASRPDNLMTRLGAAQTLAAVDREMPAE